MDSVSVPVSILSPGLSKRSEVKIGHVAISRNSSWVHLDECLQGLVRTLAKKLAEFLVMKSGEELTTDSVNVFWANKATVEQCQNYVEMISHLLISDPNKLPPVIVMENINAQGNKMSEIFELLDCSIEDTPFIICTSTPSEHIPDFSSRHHFSEILLGEDVEMMQGFLGRYLRKKMLNIEFATKLTNHDMPDAIQWILRIYCNLYIFVKTTSNTRTYLSPQMFLVCPVDSSAAMRSWFIDLWNSSIVTYLRQVCSLNLLISQNMSSVALGGSGQCGGGWDGF